MTVVSPALLSDARTLAAYAIFIGSYVVFALGKFPRMKIDRPGAAIIGGVLSRDLAVRVCVVVADTVGPYDMARINMTTPRTVKVRASTRRNQSPR